MASSLMNDSAYTHDFYNRVIEAAEIVFAEFISIRKDIGLADAELQEALEKNRRDIDLLLKKKTKEIDEIRLREKPARH